MKAILSLLLVYVQINFLNGFMSDVLIKQLLDENEGQSLINGVVRVALYETETLPFNAAANDSTLRALKNLATEREKKPLRNFEKDRHGEQYVYFLATQPKILCCFGSYSINLDNLDADTIWTSKRPFKGRITQMIQSIHKEWMKKGATGLSPAMESAVQAKPGPNVKAHFMTGLLVAGLINEQADEDEIDSWWMPFIQSPLYLEHLNPVKLAETKQAVLPMIDRAIEGLLGSRVIREGLSPELKVAMAINKNTGDVEREKGSGWWRMPEGPSPLDVLLDSLQDAVFA